MSEGVRSSLHLFHFTYSHVNMCLCIEKTLVIVKEKRVFIHIPKA